MLIIAEYKDGSQKILARGLPVQDIKDYLIAAADWEFAGCRIAPIWARLEVQIVDAYARVFAQVETYSLIA